MQFLVNEELKELLVSFSWEQISILIRNKATLLYYFHNLTNFLKVLKNSGVSGVSGNVSRARSPMKRYRQNSLRFSNLNLSVPAEKGKPAKKIMTDIIWVISCRSYWTSKNQDSIDCRRCDWGLFESVFRRNLTLKIVQTLDSRVI